MNAVATPALNATDNVFNEAYDKFNRADAYNPKWANATGYFDHAVKGVYAPVLAVGEMTKSVDEHGRPLIIIGTPIGNIIVFRRYSKEYGRYTFNAPRGFETLMCYRIVGLLREEDLHTLFGDCHNGHWIRGNIGMLIADMQNILKD
jgi:hypothetical protein